MLVPNKANKAICLPLVALKSFAVHDFDQSVTILNISLKSK